MAFALMVRWEVRPGDAAELEAIFREHQEHSRAEPGCLAWIAHRGETLGSFLLYEQFIDRAAFDAHRATPHFQRLIVDCGLPLLIREREITFAETL
ncbi:antibiotic biosynthesis monooxygenase [Solirubrobacter ginsenosidimutans]|uniref:Antibiotic biosynthesis monooxygenase n=1 Tax=Solirubrobacter ginsenosidimutans TaxID=490573 RepID=A0A9X3MQ75_9ACTN|nr:putative quinol monooxygenase [Solirubrobacter ginsenosidimutans]MDA0159245.1 antibiotic biosynthesis monooxygenase [Solirubrobacter ginsenosidimutans]